MSRSEVKVAEAPRNDRPSDKFRCGQLCQGGGLGNCPRGARPNGECGAAGELCKPVRTFRGLRRRSIFALTLLGILVIAIWSTADSSRFFKPGELSNPHAVIFSSQTGENHCAACHPNATTSFKDWFGVNDLFHNRFAQTDSCVTCHHVKIPADVARSPHNLSAQRLTEIRTANNSLDSLDSFGSIQCASCHREHGGTRAIMTAMSNAQCQSCHSRTFESFRDGHPDWRNWPHGGPQVIVFNHATHQRLHYPKAKPRSDNVSEVDAVDAAASASDLFADASLAGGRAFDCRACHPGAGPGASASDGGAFTLASFGGLSDREPLRTVGFEVACADCHAAGLKLQASQRLDLFALPSLASGPATELEPWPSVATGFFDGEIGPLTRWLINDSPRVEGAIASLPDVASITQIDPTRVDQVRSAVIVADSIRRAMDQFSSQGSNVVIARDQGRAANAMRQLLRTVPPQLVGDARRLWFDPVATTASPQQPQLSGRYAQRPTNAVDAADDPLADSVGEVASSARDRYRFDPDALLPDGGWYRDDLRLAISYRASGHADPVLKAAVELASSLPASDPVRQGLVASSALTSCIRCHVGAMHSSGSVWQTPMGRPQSKALTKFSHQPHFNLPQLSGCTHCHQPAAEVASMDEIGNHGFQSIGKSTCVSCHTKGAAGDNCTQCHHYHSHK